MARQQLTPELEQTFNRIKQACARSRYGEVRASRYPATHVAELKRRFLIYAEQPGPGWPCMVSICDDPERARQEWESLREAIRESLARDGMPKTEATKSMKYKYQPQPEVTVVFIESSGYPHWEVAKWRGSECVVGPEWFMDEKEARDYADRLGQRRVS